MAAGMVLVACLASLGLAVAVSSDWHSRASKPEFIDPVMSAGQPHFEMGAIFGGDKSLLRLRLGLDGLNAGLVLLTGLVGALAVVASLSLKMERAHRYFGWMGILVGLTLLAFLAQDLLLFYVAFDLTLSPLFLWVGNWGGPTPQGSHQS
ncbi:MAG: hypothetical protein ACKOS8_09555, partial [Gemmataceae bacterium]